MLETGYDYGQDIFKALRKVRVIAESTHSMTDETQKVGIYLWASLQAHRIMREYLSAEFEKHPDVSPVSTFFLFEHRAPTSMVRALQTEIKELSKKYEEVKNKNNSLRSDVDSLLSWKRSKKV